jgi:osmotically-inducible protein OsmY
MDDKKLRKDVIDALDGDPGVDSANVGVGVNNGVAVLTGHVWSRGEKLEAVRIAKGVRGVTAVADEIEVSYGAAVSDSDEDIALRATHVLQWDVAIPFKAVAVTVSKGWVTLSGEVECDRQRQAAETDVRKLRGVLGVTNRIALQPTVSPAG